MKNYLIPYGKRTLRLSTGYRKTKLMCVDNLGLFVEYEKEEDLTEENLRSHLIGYNSQDKMLIQAENLSDALEQFYDLEGAKTGYKHKAITLEDAEVNPIIEYAECSHLKEKEYGFHCTKYDEPDFPDSMVCILDGLSEPPCDCPIKLQREQDIYKTTQIGGIWVRTFEIEMASMPKL